MTLSKLFFLFVWQRFWSLCCCHDGSRLSCDGNLEADFLDSVANFASELLAIEVPSGATNLEVL